MRISLSIVFLFLNLSLFGQETAPKIKFKDLPRVFIEDVSRSNQWSTSRTNANISIYPLILLGAEGHNVYYSRLWGHSSGKMMDYRLAEDLKLVFVKKNCNSCSKLPSSLTWANWTEVYPVLNVLNAASNPIFENKKGNASLGDFIHPNFIIVSKVDLISRTKMDLHMSIMDIEKNTPIAIESYKNLRVPYIYRDKGHYWKTRWYIGAGSIASTAIITSIRRSNQKRLLNDPSADFELIESSMSKQRRIATWSYLVSGLMFASAEIVLSF
jgi:hypothetical protein